MKEKLSEEKTNNKSIVGKMIAAVVAVAIILILLLKGCGGTKEYVVEFNTRGGNTIESVKVKENDTVTRPEDPTKEGYIFANWYYDGELFDFDTPITKDIVLEARWRKEGEVLVESVSLDTKELSLAVDDEYTLKATVLPSDATEKGLTWASSDESIVTVDENGVLHALKEGTVTITVTTKDGNFKATCEVTVTASKEVEEPTPSQGTTTPSTSTKPSTPSNPSTPSTPSNPNTPSTSSTSVTGVTITGEKEVFIGKILQLTATVTPSNATNKKVTWSSSNPSIATVDQNGLIRGLKAGIVEITVTTEDGKKTATYQITVKEIPVEEIPVESVKIEGTTHQLEIDTTLQLQAIITPKNATDKTVTWTSSNPSVASVDANGFVTAHAVGTTTITVTTKNGKTDTYTITVTQPYTITIYPESMTLGSTMRYRFVVTGLDGKEITDYISFEYQGTVFRQSLTIAAIDIDKAITSTTLKLNNGTNGTVTARVLYQ